MSKLKTCCKSAVVGRVCVSEGDALDMQGSQLLKAYIQGRDINLFGTQQQLYERYKKKYSE